MSAQFLLIKPKSSWPLKLFWLNALALKPSPHCNLFCFFRYRFLSSFKEKRNVYGTILIAIALIISILHIDIFTSKRLNTIIFSSVSMSILVLIGFGISFMNKQDNPAVKTLDEPISFRQLHALLCFGPTQKLTLLLEQFSKAPEMSPITLAEWSEALGFKMRTPHFAHLDNPLRFVRHQNQNDRTIAHPALRTQCFREIQHYLLQQEAFKNRKVSPVKLKKNTVRKVSKRI